MHTYDQMPWVSGTRGATLLAVALLHVAVGFAFYSGLARPFMKRLDPAPFHLVDPPRPPQTSIATPPPQGTLGRPKIDVDPPEVPPIDLGPDESTVSDVPEPGASTVADTPDLPQEVVIAASQDPRHPLHLGNEFYPDASRRAGETGRCKVRVTVAADGRIVDSILEQPSGFERLDKACLNAVRGQRMNPATRNGRAVQSRVTVPISWRLTD
ncbi:MAG: TonB family protein [Steroidobacteraceae bacterium]|jgi:protein TonB